MTAEEAKKLGYEVGAYGRKGEVCLVLENRIVSEWPKEVFEDGIPSLENDTILGAIEAVEKWLKNLVESRGKKLHEASQEPNINSIPFQRRESSRIEAELQAIEDTHPEPERSKDVAGQYADDSLRREEFGSNIALVRAEAQRVRSESALNLARVKLVEAKARLINVKTFSIEIENARQSIAAR